MPWLEVLNKFELELGMLCVHNKMHTCVPGFTGGV